jgi:predicted phosphodiesterase
VEIPLEGGRTLLCFHGSPTSFDDLIFPETPQDEFARVLGPYTPAVLTGGHTHIQYVRRLSDTFYFNPGSVGVAYDRHQSEERPRMDSWAEYALLTSEGERLALEFRRVPYDTAALVVVLRASGRPYTDEMVAQYSAGAR